MVGAFPHASFGKPPGGSAYQILERDEAFEPQEIARAFQRVCSSFEWKSTIGEASHAPCFGLLRCAESILIARYRDDGRDKVGRPHTLKIDCILAAVEDFSKAWNTFTTSVECPAVPQDDLIKVFGNESTYTAQP